ncbi:hypothetical protein CANINC_004173 [Pichia inconspicua]|uniref:Uncharacterized protein n=1 Tax=Pichia inconspicua TaxID=52247 RepID=A0A4T0WX08_9ASCO|nr:hypothetical protein CANINC_004173 [[Candida] inconspicua]
MAEKEYKSLGNINNRSVLQGLTASTDFNKPISVKSKQWSHNKVNLSNRNVDGPFAQYSTLNTSHVIKPPVNPPPHSVHTNFESKEADTTPRSLIEELLKPKEFPKIEIREEDRKVNGLDVELLDHQVLGLNFMLHRETRKPKQRTYLNTLEIPQEDNETENNDSNKHTSDSFFSLGGILADDMGLGKTVQMIALILKHKSTKKVQGTTLIVCPLPLITQWNQEFVSKAPSVKVIQFHGPKRPTEPEVLFLYDVVITSYATLASEFEKDNSPLFNSSYTFRRVVLDEAHTIKNSLTKSFKACAALEARYKWCLTGTPIQNKIDELHSLLKFLSVNKYENSTVWASEIGTMLKAGDPQKVSTALSRLHKVLDKIMIRRSKQILVENNVMTVTKSIHQEILEFTPFEKKIYTKLKKRIIKNILGNDVAVDENTISEINRNNNINFDYIGALTYLLRLRQLCCHWELLFNLRKQETDGLLIEEIKKGILESDNSAVKDFKTETDVLLDDEIDKLLGSMKEMKLEEKTETKVEADFNPIHAIKLRRVMNILNKDNPKKPRKTIIFSEFVSMLNIIAKMLYEHGIKYVMYHGQMDKEEKEKTLLELRKDPTVHVLLCSLKSGAYGLNITSCSRVILYEPFWNPAIGAQAIDRAYRIGQTENVDVHEFFVADTVEMRIKELQEKKRELANAVVDKDAQSALNLVSAGLKKEELLGLLGINIIGST